MKPSSHSEEQPWTPDRWSRLAWLPIPVLLAAIIAAWMTGLRETYESHLLLLFLSFTFYTLVSLGTLYIIGRSFLGLGSPGLLFLECGVILWSLAGTIGDFVSHGDANINVTIFNASILLAGLCHLAGTILSLRPRQVIRAKTLWLVVGWAVSLVALWLVSQAALMGWLPVFFIPGQGGTPVRYIVLTAAIAMFVLSAGLLKANQRTALLPFTSWYALALLMLAVGLFGVMIQLSLGSVVNWLSRTAQWLGGVYLLLAAFFSLRTSRLPLLPLQSESKPAYYRDAVAMAIVIAAAAIRLTFLPALGTHAPFVTFYPAVIFASIYGGLRAGLLATALSALFVCYFWMDPAGPLSIRQTPDWLAMAVFLLTGAMIAGVSDAMNRAQARAFAAEKQALLAGERAAAAEALQASRAKLEAALASMTDAVSIYDVEGRMIEFNDAFTAFYRFRSRDDCARTLAEHPDIIEVCMADGTLEPQDQRAVLRALRGETATNAEYTLRRKDTGETWVGSCSFSPIRGQDGAIAGAVMACRDITERKRIAKELQRQREWLRVTLGSIGDAIIATDTEGKVTFLNTVAEALTGWPLPEAKARPVTEVFNIVNEHTRQTVESPVARVLKEGMIVGLANHTILIRRDGTEVPIDDSGAPIRDAGGNTLGVVLVFRDITERKRVEKAIQEHAAQLEDANKELESFSYTISHDLRSPLRAIDGYSRIILKNHGEEFNEATLRNFNAIRANAQRMGQLIDDLLNFSRLSRANLSLTELDMENLFQEAWKEVLDHSGDRRGDWRFTDIPRGLGDRALIKQVVGNLLANALKFSSVRPEVVIETGGYRNCNECVYYVKDNGVGFDMQYHDKIFGVFQRLHTEEEFEGTGVGLAIVQRIVHRHGGRVWAEGKEGEGATFYFTLPLSDSQDVELT